MLLKHYRFLARLLSDSETSFLCGVSNCCPGAEHKNKLTHEHYCFSFFFFFGTANTEVKLMETGDGRLEKEKHNGTEWNSMGPFNWCQRSVSKATKASSPPHIFFLNKSGCFTLDHSSSY